MIDDDCFMVSLSRDPYVFIVAHKEGASVLMPLLQ